MTILRNIRKAEETKNMFSKLRSAVNPASDLSITQLQVPTDPNQDPKTCSEWTTIDIPEDIIRELQLRNIKHFRQAHGTPFTVSPLSDSLHYTAAKGRHTMDILQGSYNATQCDEPTQQILNELSHIYTKSLTNPSAPNSHHDI